MLSTRNLALVYEDVPTSWIFEHYCNLQEELIGQSITIHSLFKQERSPSMWINPGISNKYVFKDFSTGLFGNGIELVKNIYGVSTGNAIAIIISDYNNSILKGDIRRDYSILKKDKFRVSDYILRGWNNKDVEFWPQFNIGSSLLERYNVFPLERYTLTRGDESFTVSSNLIYGYFTNTGILYRIYQPHDKNKKFLILNRYLQGSDQLKGYDTLLIMSSLKDVMSLQSLSLMIDAIAPNSENTILPQDIISDYQSKYKYIGVLLDNDSAGIDSMKIYKERYGLTPILLPLSKDVSDSVRDYSPLLVKERIIPIISNNIPQLL